MKSIILSDIDHEDKGIIPWSLKFAKELKSEVNVIHVIDTRDIHGIYTPYSDSKSVTPGVESFDEVLEKEKKTASDFLSKHVGRVTSTLDFPLKTDYEVRVGPLDELIIAESHKPEHGLLMISSSPQGKAWSTSDDIFYIVANADNPVLLVPSKIDYKKPEKILFLTHLDDSEPESLDSALNLLQPFDHQMIALNISGKNDAKEYITENKAWKKVSDQLDDIYSQEETDPESIQAFVVKQGVDMIILIEKKRNILQRLVSKSMTEKLAQQIELPILVFYK